MSGAPHILVFDSGVGGLSIVGEIRRALPQATISYASDNGYFPYGTKSESALVDRVDRVLRALVKETHPHMIVVACNTASTVALPHVRAHFSLPIVGVVPAIKPAAQTSRSKVIGLLGTPGTVTRDYTRQLINDFAADCQILPVGSSALVELAELKLRGQEPDSNQFLEALQPLIQSEHFAALDTVVLACTHFPLVREELSAALGKPVSWVDSGEAIARRVSSLLASGELAHSAEDGAPGHRCFFTSRQPEVEELRPALARWLPGTIGFVEVSGS